MFSGSGDKRTDFVKNKQKERQERQDGLKRQEAILKIQATARMFLCRLKVMRKFRAEFDQVIRKGSTDTNIEAFTLFKQLKTLLFVYKQKVDDERLYNLCATILYNLEHATEPRYWYMSVMLLKQHTAAWIATLKKLLHLCSKAITLEKFTCTTESKVAQIYIQMLLSFTDCSNWKILKIKGGENIAAIMKQLCNTVLSELISKGLIISIKGCLVGNLARNGTNITKLLFSSINSLLIRCLSDHPEVDYMLTQHILTIPAFVFYLQKCEKLDAWKGLYRRVLTFLHNYENLKKTQAQLDAISTLALLGNLVNLVKLNLESFTEQKSKFKTIVGGLLNHCQLFVGNNKASNLTWHPVLGWYKKSENKSWSETSTQHVLGQLKSLWQHPLMGSLFENLPSLEETEAMISPQASESKGGMLRKKLLKAFTKKGGEMIDVNEPIVLDICSSCDLYRTLYLSLTQLKMEIVAALSLQEEILVRLWRFVYTLGEGDKGGSLLNHIEEGGCNLPQPLASLLILFCECSTQLICILDDEEIYEKQKPFSCSDLAKMGYFLNHMVFKFIWHTPEVSSIRDKQAHEVKNAALDLLLLLYDRNCRKQFTSQSHWFIRDLKMSQFHNELKTKQSRSSSLLHSIPHIVPHIDRVKIFHSWIKEEKQSLGIDKELSPASALVSIRRSRLLEDGYEQLNKCKTNQLKGIIRVKFVNEQGLDEAGIDQDGVFKEFLEDVIAQAFNPQLNLFKMTCGEEQRLYPSTTSFIHENHLQLFEFVGKMLGKAVYEGILVDVQFASFFLNLMLQRKTSHMYSSLDELPSLDPEMYKNLNFIKNYKGDVSDLDLVFAYDEDVLGKVVTHDLKPGGRVVNVNNSNKLSYIHLMARFRLNTQIKQQSAAFICGFKSIISGEWLKIFSAPQLQKLISGSMGTIDLQDLKNNTRYYGGYHSNHPTIVWLWDILIHDLTLPEKKLFLKFVTSCSNPPLLGFRYLEPQFSIRFVDNPEDENSGDTASSVMRGLFNLRKRGSSNSAARLPTSSTCFNLLKLPCYKKKSVLKEKLKYAIKSGAGFELS